MPENKIIQSIFKLYNKNNYYPDDFILSNANHKAYIYISKWPKWYGNSCYIHGDSGTGKTHLAYIWKQKSDAYDIKLFQLNKKKLEKILKKYESFILEDIEQYFTRKSILQNLDNHDFDEIEETIIHILDYCKNNKKALLITSNSRKGELAIKTKDLNSRINATNDFSIDYPEESSLYTLLIKLFAYHQISVSRDVINYISKNCKKSFKYATLIAQELDKKSLSNKCRITKDFAKRIIAQNP